MLTISFDVQFGFIKNIYIQKRFTHISFFFKSFHFDNDTYIGRDLVNSRLVRPLNLCEGAEKDVNIRTLYWRKLMIGAD